jgi:lipoyl(octanoyl) transferase
MAELRVTQFPEPVPYLAGVALQEEARAVVQAGGSPQLMLLEHQPVYTRGRRAKPEELPMGEDWYRARGIEVCDTDRGGAVTYHGPGQLVGYPIMRIDGVREYVAALERAIIAALADEGVKAELRDGLTGVWASRGKIASIGVHVSRGVTTHGFAVNVDNDLQPFEWVVPCGMQSARMSSISDETGEAGRMKPFREALVNRFCETFGLTPKTSQAKRPVVSMAG